MHIFRVKDLRLSPINIIADDIQHASLTMLLGLYEGLGHWPPASYSIAPWVPSKEMAPDLLNQMAEEHRGGFATFDGYGWEVISRDRHRTF